MSKVLCLDMDGVLYNWHNAVFEYVTMYKGYNKSFTELWSRDYLYFTEGDWEFMTYIDILYSNQAPTPDCVSFLNNVKYRFEIYYITARPTYVKTTTQQYLNRYKFPFRHNLFFEPDKVSMARLLKADYFIDDIPANISKLQSVTKTIMIARPYNRDYWDTTTTAFSLMGALKFLED